MKRRVKKEEKEERKRREEGKRKEDKIGEKKRREMRRKVKDWDDSYIELCSEMRKEDQIKIKLLTTLISDGMELEDKIWNPER